MANLRQRVQALSSEQRIELARRLRLRNGGLDGNASSFSNKQLVAYVVAAQGEFLDTEMIRRSLQDQLPDYMVPAMFVPLDELPRMPNGKVDRRALLDIEIAPLYDSFESDFVAPRSAIEERLVKIWTELLGFDMISIHDKFFELGGHSLLAMQVVSRIGQQLQIEISVRTFFEDPTVAGLARHIEQLSQNAGEVVSEEREEFVI